VNKLNETNERQKEVEKPSEQRISPLEIKILNELQIIQFLDNIIEDSLLYIFNKSVKHFQRDIENYIEKSESDLKDIWKDNKNELENIIKFSEDLAKKNGVKRALQKETLIWSIPIYAIVIGLSFVMYFFVPQDLMMFFLIIPFLILCITNSLVSKIVINKRMKFRVEKAPILKEQMKESIERIRNVNQIIINNIKDTILENKFESTRFKAYLYNKNYENIKILETKEQHNLPIYLIAIDLSDQNQ